MEHLLSCQNHGPRNPFGCVYELGLPCLDVLVVALLVGVYIRAAILGNSHFLVKATILGTLEVQPGTPQQKRHLEDSCLRHKSEMVTYEVIRRILSCILQGGTS